MKLIMTDANFLTKYVTKKMTISPDNETKNLPVIGLEQAVHRLEKSSPKHSAQYGLSSLEVNL